MRVEGQTGCAGQRTNYWYSERDVGHEVAVHHVHVDDGGAAALGRLDLLAEPREICRKDGRRNLDHGTSPWTGARLKGSDGGWRWRPRGARCWSSSCEVGSWRWSGSGSSSAAAAACSRSSSRG